MLNKRLFTVIIPMAAILFCTSCVSLKEMVYLQGSKKLFETPEKIKESYELHIQSGDLLYIILNARETALLENFANTELLGTPGKFSSGVQQAVGLRVDKNGNIQVPVLGETHAAGLSCQELSEAIKRKLIEREYFKEPVVTVQIKSFHVTIIGEVYNPGLKEISNDRITILEALGMAGDLTPSAKRENIIVVREENGERRSYMIDLTSAANVYNSPCFYLRQNDVIYVEPNKSIRVKGSYTLSYLSPIGTVVSVLATVASIALSLVVLNNNK
jgi:polysaccharide export outer membrane protein